MGSEQKTYQLMGARKIAILNRKGTVMKAISNTYPGTALVGKVMLSSHLIRAEMGLNALRADLC